MYGQPDPTRIQRRKDPMAILGIPILVVIAILAATAIVVPSRAAATMQCWRLLDRLPVTESARVCEPTPPFLHVGRVALYSPIAPFEWVNVFIPNRRLYAKRMPLRDRARVYQAFGDMTRTWLVAVSVSGAFFLAVLIVLKRVQKPERIQLYGTRFFADRDEVLASGLVVGYKVPWHLRLRKWLNQ